MNPARVADSVAAMPSVTPAAVRARFAVLAHVPTTPLPSAFLTEAYPDWVDAIEVAADAHPGDVRWTELLLDAQLLARPVPHLPAWRCIRCIRADRVSATWLARDSDARTWLVRHADDSPLARRVLARDARVLRGALPGLEVREGLLAAPAPGSPLTEGLDPEMPRAERVRLLADTLRRLQGFDGLGWGPGAPVQDELRRTFSAERSEVVLIALTPAEPGTRDALRAVIDALPPETGEADGPIDRFLAGLATLDSPDPHEAEALLKRALVESLNEQAIRFRQRRLQTRQDSRRERFQQVLERLVTAIEPPTGEGPIGFDLEGRTTHVVSDGTTIRWGPTDEAGDVLFGEDGFDAPMARRFLRACATAPARPEGSGDPVVTEHINRWVSAGLRLRTLKMLLDRAPGTSG